MPVSDKDDNNVCQENKIGYLQLLQEPIGRMSSTSAIFKGFSAAILAGLASASFTEISIWALALGMLPILSFLCLDIYYLRLERKMKYRYQMVVQGKAPVDYSIHFELTKEEKKTAKMNPLMCLLSPSIWLFYIPVIGCALALLIIKICGVI